MKLIILLTALFPILTIGAELLPQVEVTHESEESNLTPVHTNQASRSSDTSKLIDNVPGVSIREAGGISSLPAIHGLSNDRVNVRIDDVLITSACPNHMNSALTYVDPEKVAQIDVMAGITPVSQGGDSIGGSVLVKTKRPVFSEDESLYKKLTTTTFFKSNNENLGATVGVNVASENFSFAFEGLDEKADRYRDGNGDRLKGTIYNQNNQSITLAQKALGGVVSLKATRANVPYQGFVNQYMDMNDNKSDSANLSYLGEVGEFVIESNASFKHTDHYMDKLTSERSGAMPMYTSSDELGFNLKASTNLNALHTLNFGGDYNQFRLEDWWEPVGMGSMAPDTFRSVHLGKRDRLGVYVEDKSQWSESFSTLIGLRADLVSMDAGDVKGYNSTNNLPADADAFNSKDREKNDTNWDATLLAKHKLNTSDSIEYGYGRKTRSPNMYERYAWAGAVTNTTMPARMDMRMINWFGDGNGYVGDIGLKPEVAHTLSATLSRSEGTWGASITPYATYVKDFIDADLLSTDASGRNYLQFANHDVHLMGIDFAAQTTLLKGSGLGDVKLKVAGDYTRGYRIDGEADLYHLMPLNGKITFEHEKDKWMNQLSFLLVNQKKQVNNLRREVETAGYGIVDLSTSYQLTKQARVDFAITNLLDKTYALPLGGVDIVNNTNYSTALLGMGRSFNTALKLNF
jgi:iron complex outermembrane recepter protein